MCINGYLLRDTGTDGCCRKSETYLPEDLLDRIGAFDKTIAAGRQ